MANAEHGYCLPKIRACKRPAFELSEENKYVCFCANSMQHPCIQWFTGCRTWPLCCRLSICHCSKTIAPEHCCFTALNMVSLICVTWESNAGFTAGMHCVEVTVTHGIVNKGQQSGTNSPRQSEVMMRTSPHPPYCVDGNGLFHLAPHLSAKRRDLLTV